MGTLRPFILSSLALHLLGVGLLLFWMFSPPAVSREEIKVLTVMLVSEENTGGGSKIGAGLPRPYSKSQPPSSEKEELSRVLPGSLRHHNSSSAPPPASLTGELSGLSGPASPAEGLTGQGISGGPGSSPGGGGGKMAGLPGTGGGEGAGTGDGNGWGRGGDDRLYLLGGYQVTPRYPASARRQGREGTAFLKIKISPEGKVLEVLVAQSSGHQDLDEAAVEAVKFWRFQPPKKGEQKVSLWARVPIKFQLRNK